MKKLFQKHTFLLLAVLLPVLAMADDEKINLNKYVTENADGTYTLDLETYATGYTQHTAAANATDFVLVLDRSGTMSNNYVRGDRVATGTTLNSSMMYQIVESGRTMNLVWQNNRWERCSTGTTIIDSSAGEPVFSTTSTYAVKSTDEIYMVTSQTRLDALKEAVKTFVEVVCENNPTTGLKHRIALVWYGGTDSGGGKVSDYKGTTSTSSTASFTLYELVKSAAASGQVLLSTYLSNIDAVTSTTPNVGNATMADFGLQVAYNTLNAAKSDGRNKVTVFFTDGEPGLYSGMFHVNTAKNACKQAANLKSSTLKNGDTDPLVYSVGIMDGSTASYHVTGNAYYNYGAGTKTNDKYRFMHYISSNYILSSSTLDGTSDYLASDITSLTCQGLKDDETACTGHGSEAPHGYFTRSDGSNLSTIFKRIAGEVIDRNESLDATSTLLLDALTDDFKFPEGFDSSVIRLFTCDAVFTNTSTSVEWSTTGTDGITVYKDASDKRVASSVTGGHSEYWIPITTPTPAYSSTDKQITVSGYSFKDNFVGPIKDPSGNIIGWTGQKLIVEFDIERDPVTPGRDNEMKTNKNNSGVYVNNSLLVSYPIPTVPVPNIIIAKKGLKAGESAVFEVVRVTDATGGTADAVNTFQHTVVLTASSSNPNPTVEFVASGPGYYKVTEKSWTWNYVTTYDSNADGTPETDGASYVQQIASTDTDKTFTFGIKSGSKKTGVRVEFYDEKGVNNNFK